MSIINEKILEELSRYNSINNYITEQDAAAAEPPTEIPADTAQPETDPMLEPTADSKPEVIDVEADSEVQKISNDGNVEDTSSESGSEELDITELVTTQKDMSQKQNEYFDMMFKQLEGLQSKLSEMDNVFEKLTSMEEKIEKYRPKTPEEKLELRSLDSGPFQQKLSDFFQDKQEDMQKTGKNEYILTTQDVENFTPNEIKQSFDTTLPEPGDSKFRMS